MKLSIGVLAGGKSTRMGRDKGLLKLNRETFLEHIMEEMKEFDDRLVSVDDKNKYKALAPYHFVEDEYRNSGPLEGIRRILYQARNDYTFICAADMPFIKKELVSYMQEFISGVYDCYVIETDSGRQPLCAIYSRKTAEIIELMIREKDYRLNSLLDRCNVKYIPLKYTCFDKKVISNINTSEDYKEALKPLVFCISGVKNSGKTTLMERMIPELLKEFPRIGAIKHDGHDFVMDRKGTDTKRFTDAGAIMTGIYSDRQTAVLSRNFGEGELPALEFMGGLDLIILEGLKNSSYPKLEIVRKGISGESVCRKENLIAIATDLDRVHNSGNIRLVDLNDTKLVIKTVLDYFSYHFVI